MRKTALLAATAAAGLLLAGSANAAIVFNYVSVSSNDTTAAASNNAANTSAYTTGTAQAFGDAYGLGDTPVAVADHVSTDAVTLTPTFIHHPDTFAANDPGHLHPIHHPDTPGPILTTLNANAQATEAATAYFADAANGTFSFSGDTSATVYTANAGAMAYNGGQQIIYDFSNIGTSIFTLNYVLAESYNFANPHNVFSLTDLTAPGLSIGPTALGNNLSNALVFNLVDGHDYELAVSSSVKDDFASRITIGTTLGSHSEVYDWTVTSVPEPTAWALMLMGFGGLGGILRRRRSLALAA